LLFGVFLEAVDHLGANIERERARYFENEATGFYFRDGFIHCLLRAVNDFDFNLKRRFESSPRLASPVTARIPKLGRESNVEKAYHAFENR
jgi:hypothetical protein